jgi:hypothetical protein
MSDIGVSCTKGSYGRGAGYGIQSGDCDSALYVRCEAENGKDRCEKYGDIVYPKCKAGYKIDGCCLW